MGFTNQVLYRVDIEQYDAAICLLTIKIGMSFLTKNFLCIELLYMNTSLETPLPYIKDNSIIIMSGLIIFINSYHYILFNMSKVYNSISLSNLEPTSAV